MRGAFFDCANVIQARDDVREHNKSLAKAAQDAGKNELSCETHVYFNRYAKERMSFYDELSANSTVFKKGNSSIRRLLSP